MSKRVFIKTLFIKLAIKLMRVDFFIINIFFLERVSLFGDTERISIKDFVNFGFRFYFRLISMFFIGV